MTEPNSIGTARKLLREAVAEFQAPPCHPVTISPWVAMSLLQKGDQARSQRHISAGRLGHYRRSTTLPL